MGLLSLATAMERIERSALAMEEMEHRVLTEAAKAIQKGAKEQIGHYLTEDDGKFGSWLPLAESTVEDKEKQGYAPPDNPLLREGDMRESIEYTVSGAEAQIGSNSDIALWQELGTRGPGVSASGYHVPPRSFLGSTAFRLKDKIGQQVGYSIVSALIEGKQTVVHIKD